MPKGVEHKKSAQTLPMVLGVESLMPKGVEHSLHFLLKTLQVLCRISDAERR